MKKIDVLLDELESSLDAATNHIVPSIRGEIGIKPLPLIRFDTRRKMAESGGVAVILTRLQLDLLRRVAAAKKRRITEQRAERLVWRRNDVSSHAINVTVGNMRAKMSTVVFPYTIFCRSGKIILELATDSK